MIKISCYKTIQEKLPRAFCMLAEKCYHSAIKIFVYTNSTEQAIEFDKALWIYSRKQFIPHGTIYDQFPEKQPILIGAELKNFNNSSSIIIINADENKILSILSTNENFDFTICERLFLLYDNTILISGHDVQNIISKSPLIKPSFEYHSQENNNSWRKII